MSLTAIVLTALLMHPVHETVCEVQWNAESKTTEVAIRLDGLDEEWIEKQHKDTFSKSDTDWRQAFLKAHVIFDPIRRGKSALWPSGRPIRWHGRKEDGAHVWWFFEVKGEPFEPPKNVQMRILFDRNKNYQHRIIVLGKNPDGSANSKAVVLTLKRPEADLPSLR